MLSETINVAASFPSSIRYIENGDPLNTGNFQANAEDVAAMGGHLIGTGPNLEVGNKYRLKSRSVTITLDSRAIVDPANWLPSLTAVGVWVCQTTTANRPIWLPFSPPVGMTLTGWEVYVKGAAGHVGLPAVMPQVQLGQYRIDTGAFTSISLVSDASANTANYQALHAVSATSLTHVVDRSVYRYTIGLNNESGANALVGLELHGARLTFTITALPDLQM